MIGRAFKLPLLVAAMEFWVSQFWFRLSHQAEMKHLLHSQGNLEWM